MIIRSLHLNNFKQYQQLDLSFREGLVGIVGKNGAGKSTIFEGILLCLFGSISSDKDFYKTSWADKKEPVKLELHFEVEQKVYRVVREFRGKALTHQAGFYNQEDLQVASGATPVNEAVTKVIGMDKDAFTRSIFSGQKELGILSNTRGEERKKMIRKMIGLDNLDQIQKLIREDRNSLKKQIQGQAELQLDTETIKVIKQSIKEFQKNIRSSEQTLTKDRKATAKKQEQYLKAKKDFDHQLQLYQQHNSLQQELKKFETLLEGLNEQLVEKNSVIQQLQAQEKEQVNKAPLVEKHLAQKKQKTAFDEAKKQFDKKNQLVQQQDNYQQRINELKVNIAKLQESLSSVAKLETQVESLTNTVEKGKIAIEKQEQHHRAINSKIGAIEGKVEERKQQIQTIQQLGKEAECPTCLQPLINSYDQTIGHLQKAIDGYEQAELTKERETLKSAQTQLSSLKKETEKQVQSLNKLQAERLVLGQKEQQLTDERNRLQKGEQLLFENQKAIEALGTIQFNEEDYQKLTTAITEFEPVYIQYRSIQDDLAKMPELIQQKEQLTKRIEAGTTKIKEQERKAKTLQFSDENYRESQRIQSVLEEEKDQLNEALRQAELAHKQLEHALKTEQQQLDNDEKIKSTIANNQTEMDTLEELDGIFKTFKTYILDRVKPTITQYASDLFQRITKGRYESIQINEDFEFFIHENGQPYPITRFSGGEIDLANLCLRIGISKAIAELSGQTHTLTFLGFDEIFGSQDEERRFEILAALDLLKEQYRQIYIITHVDVVKEHFPNILQIKKGSNGSEISWI